MHLSSARHSWMYLDVLGYTWDIFGSNELFGSARGLQVCSESRLAYLLAAGKLGWVSRPGLPLEWPQMNFH